MKLRKKRSCGCIMCSTLTRSPRQKTEKMKARVFKRSDKVLCGWVLLRIGRGETLRAADGLRRDSHMRQK